MAAAAPTAARLERQVVALLRPQVLVALSLGPGARAAAGLEVGEHAQLPLLEALPVHVAAGGARVVVAQHAHGVLGAHGVARAQALAGHAARARVLGASLAGGAVPPRGHAAVTPYRVGRAGL